MPDTFSTRSDLAALVIARLEEVRDMRQLRNRVYGIPVTVAGWNNEVINFWMQPENMRFLQEHQREIAV